jgi:hypothetical protein
MCVNFRNFYHGEHGGKNGKSYQNSVLLRGFIFLNIRPLHGLPFVFLPVLFFLCGFLPARDLPVTEEPAKENFDKLIFKIAVFGPSDEIFIWWGHAALIVEDVSTGYARIYDWGIFSYPGDNFLKAFAQNGVRYKCGVSPAHWDIEDYTADDRDIVLYTLDLEPSKKETILRYADNNILPDNCWYVYHQFNDNCSTRVRDLADMGTGGQFREYSENSRGRFTLRGHMRRFTRGNLFFDWAMGFLLGRDVDRNISMWEEMYLPAELGRNIAGFNYFDDSGALRKFVTDVEIVNESKKRKAVLDAPWNLCPYALAIGLAAAAFLALVRLLRKKLPRLGRALWGVSHCITGLVFGLAGLVLFAASRVPDRDYMRHNINLLFVNPLLLAAIPLGIMAAFGGKFAVGKKFPVSAENCLRVLWLYVFSAALAGALINFLPSLRQGNWPVLALTLPVALAFAVPEKRLAYV